MTRYALISVTNKKNVADFSRSLINLGFKILSTGGTAELLESQGIQVVKVSDYTGFPEILDGRVKTLHPRIHAGILADPTNAKHKTQLEELKIDKIEVVCINLYDFTEEAVHKNLSFEEAIEYIDVGGPSMLRGAAKNCKSTWAVSDCEDYAEVIRALSSGRDGEIFRNHLAVKAFMISASYEQEIFKYLDEKLSAQTRPKNVELTLVQKLRYGENAQQEAAFYATDGFTGLAKAKILQGKELSYNNILDLSAAAELILDLEVFNHPATVIIKHTNPCGVALGASLEESFDKAWRCDPKSAFGGIICCSEIIDQNLAAKISELFIECIAAPDFSDEALKIFRRKKNLRLLKIDLDKVKSKLNYRSVWGGLLEQTEDFGPSDLSSWNQVTARKVNAVELGELHFAEVVSKHTKSNAIVLTQNNATIGIGCGQVSRVDALDLSLKKAVSFGHTVAGSYLASDAFFPFSDCVEIAAKHGVSAIVQPGGSVKDQESIDSADKFKIAMIFSKVRHFKH